jgi:hypothetical protein
LAGLASAVALTFGIIEWSRGELPATLSAWPKLAFLVVLPALVLVIEAVLLLIEAWRRPKRNTTEEKEERDRNLKALRQVAEQALRQRFGPLSKKVRRRLEKMDSIEDLGRLLARSGSATPTELGFPELEPPKAEPEELRKAS